MDVRRLREGEVPSLVDELYLPFAREMADLDDYNELRDETTVRASNLDYRRDQLADEETRIWVAERDGAGLVGYVVARVKEAPPVFARGPTVHVEELYVLPEHRGEGCADALMDRAAEWGEAEDCERLGLSVNAENERARAFYERRGLEVRRLKLDRAL